MAMGGEEFSMNQVMENTELIRVSAWKFLYL